MIDERNHDDKINDLTDDLITVLDGHMDDLEMSDLFYESLKFMTMMACECLEDDRESVRVLRRAIDDGIISYMDRYKLAKYRCSVMI